MSYSKRKLKKPAKLPSSSRPKFLAPQTALHEDRCTMNSAGRSQNSARALVAVLLFAAFCWTLLVSVSPQSHIRIHADGNQVDHVCAVTLIASGSYEHAGQPPLISAPQFNVCFPERSPLTSTWVKPLFFSAHIFAHAPPAPV